MEGPAQLVAVDVTDRPGLWSDLGFTVVGDRCRVGDVDLRLGAPPRDGTEGLTGWVLSGAAGLTEVPTGDPDPMEPDAHKAAPPSPGAGRAAASGDVSGIHPNGVTAIDHVVVTTPDLDQTVSAFEAAGVALRRVRDAGGGATQAFFRLGAVIVEVVTGGKGGTGPAALWGLAFTVADLDTTASILGDRLKAPRAAVQPGRRIATLDRAAGSSVPMVFMSPARPA